MVFLLLALRDRGLLLADKAKNFSGIRIKKRFILQASACLLFISLEGGFCRWRHNLEENPYGTARLRVTGASTGNLYSAHVEGATHTSSQFHGKREKQQVEEFGGHEFFIRTPYPALKLIVWEQNKGYWNKSKTLVGYCQLPLALLGPRKRYEGQLRLYQPLNETPVGVVDIEIEYETDASKLRAAFLTKLREPVASGRKTQEGVDDLTLMAEIERSRRQLDLVDMVSRLEDVLLWANDVSRLISSCMNWENPARTGTFGIFCALVTARPQFAGVWFHTALTSIMGYSYYLHCLMPSRRKDETLAQWFKSTLLTCSPEKEDSSMELTTKSAQEDASWVATEDASLDQVQKQQPSTQASWVETADRLSMRSLGAAMRPFAPVVEQIHDFGSLLRRIVTWEDKRTSSLVMSASFLLGSLTGFIRWPRQRPTTYLYGFLALNILLSAPFTTSVGSQVSYVFRPTWPHVEDLTPIRDGPPPWKQTVKAFRDEIQSGTSWWNLHGTRVRKRATEIWLERWKK